MCFRPRFITKTRVLGWQCSGCPTDTTLARASSAETATRTDISPRTAPRQRSVWLCAQQFLHTDKYDNLTNWLVCVLVYGWPSGAEVVPLLPLWHFRSHCQSMSQQALPQLRLARPQLWLLQREGVLAQAVPPLQHERSLLWREYDEFELDVRVWFSVRLSPTAVRLSKSNQGYEKAQTTLTHYHHMYCLEFGHTDQVQ